MVGLVFVCNPEVEQISLETVVDGNSLGFYDTVMLRQPSVITSENKLKITGVRRHNTGMNEE